MSPVHKWLIAILALAFTLRAGTAVVLQWQLDHRLHRQFLVPGDADGYWHLGRQIATGGAYEMYSPPRQVLRMPGFPAFLALTMRVFPSRMLWTRFSLCLVGTAACGLVYLLGRTLVDPRTGLVAAGLAAVSPPMVAFTPLILSETLFALCLLGSLWTMARLSRRHSAHAGDGTITPARPGGRDAWLALLVGALVGVACYVRPSWLLAGPLYGAALVIASPRRAMAAWHAVLVAAGLFAVLLPWGVRNARATGHFVLTTLWVGPSLYDGLNPAATGDSDMSFFDRDNLMGGQGLTEYEMDRHYRRAAWDFVRDNPGRAWTLALVKLGRYWNPWPNAAQFDHWAVRTAYGAFCVPAALAALVGAWRLRSRFWPVALTLGPILYFAAIHVVFVSSLRYRLPAEYPLLVLSAVGVRLFVGRISNPSAVPLD